MSSTDIILKFSYPPAESNSDMRTFNVYRVYEGSTDQLELYKFYHPNTGLSIGVTTFHRKNTTTSKWETAGEIEWSSDTNATVHFGIDEVPMRELRKPKNTNSKSRRFKASGHEYKWKVAEGDKDLFCVDSRGKKVATWTQDDLTLRVEARGEGVLDRIVVTCLLNSWMKGQGMW
ncbi:hypothetical protein EWM64_g4609 [Hericium alpestre]|uniref:DUF6593 domain-containing protein n=1 Tax=Hericium alpestre TaxID=135208 RepID=A0A4Z0A0T8_9AGAM|nr:hypothetical protein EWM64_g4609 [Hericium alpestre]